MARTGLNFTGAGVDVVDDLAGDQITVTIPGGAVAGRAAPRDANLGAVGGAQAVDFGGVDYDVCIRLTLTANVTLNLQNVPALARVSIRCQQATTGGPFTLTLTQDGSATTIRWDAGVAHDMSTATAAIDRIAGEKAATNIELGTVGKAFG